MYTARLNEEDEQQDLPDTDYNTMIALEREKKKRAAEEAARLSNRTPEEIEADSEAVRRNLLKCKYCLSVLGRRDQIGNDYDYVLREHEENCFQALEARKEKDSLRDIQKKAISLILTATSFANEYRRAKYFFDLEPAPGNADKPHDSEDYKFERDWNEKKLTEQSSRLVYAWENLVKFKDSSEQARYAVHHYWRDQISTYEDPKNGLMMYRMKNFSI